MTALGIALLIVGAALLVAEAPLPTAGVLGLFGVAALGVGGWAALTGAGAVAGLAIAVAVAVALVAGGLLLFARTKGASRGRTRPRLGRAHGCARAQTPQPRRPRGPGRPRGHRPRGGPRVRRRRAVAGAA